MLNEHDTLNRDTFKIGQYIVDRKRIGKGASGTIYKGYHKDTLLNVAIKEISVSNIHDVSRNIKREIGLMKRLKHPNIIELYEVIFDGKYDNVYLIIEYCPKGDFNKFQRHKPIQEIHVQKYMKQLMMGLKYLKENNIMHRDLKPQNILITTDGNIKLTDFGYAKKIRPDDMAKTFCGSPLYMAPEIIKSKGNNNKYSIKSDLWSVGCIFYEMITGVHPFRVKNFNELIQKMDDDVILPDVFNISDEARELLFSLLKVDPEDRISWENFFSHIWFQKDLLIVEENKLLAFDIESENDGFSTELPSISLYEKNTKIFMSTHLTSSGIRVNNRHKINTTKSPHEYIVIGTPPKQILEDNEIMTKAIEQRLEDNIVYNRNLSDMYNEYIKSPTDTNEELFFSCDSESGGKELLDSIDDVIDELETEQYDNEMDTQFSIEIEAEVETDYNLRSYTDPDELLVNSSVYDSNHFGQYDYNVTEFSTSLISTETSLTTEQSDPYVIVNHMPRNKPISHSDQRDYRKFKLNKIVKNSIGFLKGSLSYINSYSGSI